MDLISVLGEILLGVFIDVTSDQIGDVLSQVFSDPSNLVMTGSVHDAISALTDGLAGHGLDLSALSDRDWYSIGEALLASR